MSTLSVPLTPEIEAMVTKLVKNGFAANKAEAARKAIIKVAEDEAIEMVLKSEREAKEGKLLRGDLKKLTELIS